MPSTEKPDIPLAQVIEDLRAELLSALQSGAGAELQFRLKPIELELQLAVTKNGQANAGVKFWVLEFGAKGSMESAVTHTLKLTLEPMGRDGKEVLISSMSSRPD